MMHVYCNLKMEKYENLILHLPSSTYGKGKLSFFAPNQIKFNDI